MHSSTVSAAWGGVQNVAQMLDTQLGPRQRPKLSISTNTTDRTSASSPERVNGSSNRYGRFADESLFRKEIEEFQRYHTAGSLQRVMPSRAQLKVAGRRDLLSALDRFAFPCLFFLRAM